MKYFLDQEFIEGFHKPLFGKKRHFIDLIKIGIVAEDGRQYSALCSDYNYDKASPWVKENVIQPLYKYTVPADMRSGEFGSSFVPIHQFHEVFGKSRLEIAEEVIRFIGFSAGTNTFYGYYADYDWVLLCSLFGTMMDLPHTFPMYCRDLKQMLDERVERIMQLSGLTFDAALARVKSSSDYPVCLNEHDALADAQFNKDLYDFLQKL